jgi:hypothetical protein
VALFVVAGLVVAYTQGWLFASKPVDVQTPQERAEQQKQYQEQQKHADEQIKKGTAVIGGSS